MLPFSVGKVYAGNDVRNFLGPGLLVETGESGFNANPPVAPFIFVRPRVRAPPRTYIYTHKRRIVEPRGGEWKRVQRTRPARIAIDRRPTLSRFELQVHTGYAPAASLCGYLERDPPKLHVHSHVYGVFACRVIAAITANRQMQKNARHGKWYPPREGSSFEYDKNGIKIRNQENIVPTFLPVTCAFNASTFYVLRAQ